MVDDAWLRILSGAFVACAWVSMASAADPVRHRCAAVADDLDRLACYDAEYGRPEPAGATPTQAAVPAPQPGAARSAPIAPATAAATAAAAVGTAAAPGVSGDADFGLSKWTKRNLDPEAAKAAPQRITARIRHVERQRDGRFVVTLDNEQVWLQTETMSRARVAVDDDITIREASLGSFLLVTASEVATRVRRVR